MVFEVFLKVRAETFDKLNSLPRPTSRKIGGTYYGGTQLFSSVGNHLDVIDEEPYQKRDSYTGIYTRYEKIWALRIGGAFDLDDYREYRNFIKEHKDMLAEEGYSIVDEYGTNFGVYGVGIRKENL
jgi:hypothetical protein